MRAPHGDLIGRLRSWWPPHRREAARRLGREGVVDAVEPLIRLLDDWYPDARVATAEALGLLGDPKAIPPLVMALVGSSGQMRSAVAGALLHLGYHGSAGVLARMVSDPPCHAYACETLLRLGDEAIPEILREMECEPDESRRRALGNLLVRFGSLAIPHLADLLAEHPARPVRCEIARVLGDTGDKAAVKHLIPVLGDPSPEVCREVALALACLGEEPFVKMVRNALLGDMQELRLRPDRRAVAPLLRSLDDDSPATRACAAEALGVLGDIGAAKHLLSLLGDPSATARKSASQALECLGEGELATAVLSALDGHADALQELYDLRAVPPLLRALGDETGAPAAGRALVALGDMAIAPLIAALNDPSEITRTRVVTVLAEIGSPAVPPLVEALGEDAPGIRSRAAEALGWIGDASSVPALAKRLEDANVHVQGAAMGALLHIGAPSVEALVEILRNGGRGARAAAAEALGRIGDPRALGPLLRALDHATASTRVAAAMGLGHLGHVAGGALTALDRRAEDERNSDVRRACRRAAEAIRKALAGAPAELEAASAPEGRGTEPEAALPPEGRGTELEADP